MGPGTSQSNAEKNTDSFPIDLLYFALNYVLMQDYFYDWRPATSDVVREMEAEMLEARIQDSLSQSAARRVLSSVTSLYHVSVQDTMAYLDCCP